MLGLRRFEESDFDAVWALHDAALEDAGAHGGHGPWEDDLRDIPGTYLEAVGEFLVAIDGDELIGMGGLLRHGDGVWEIRRMRVAPEAQRKGIGRWILEELESRAGERGAETVALDTTEAQTAARRFYEAAGYRETGRRETGGFVFIDLAKNLG